MSGLEVVADWLGSAGYLQSHGEMALGHRDSKKVADAAVEPAEDEFSRWVKEEGITPEEVRQAELEIEKEDEATLAAFRARTSEEDRAFRVWLSEQESYSEPAAGVEGEFAEEPLALQEGVDAEQLADAPVVVTPAIEPLTESEEQTSRELDELQQELGMTDEEFDQCFEEALAEEDERIQSEHEPFEAELFDEWKKEQEELKAQAVLQRERDIEVAAFEKRRRETWRRNGTISDKRQEFYACRQCGAGLPLETDKCQYCGRDWPLNDGACHRCGNSIPRQVKKCPDCRMRNLDRDYDVNTRYLVLGWSVGIIAFVAMMVGIFVLFDLLGVPSDNPGVYPEESESTSYTYGAMAVAAMLAAWVGGAVYYRNLRVGLSAQDQIVSLASLGGVSAYTAVIIVFLKIIPKWVESAWAIPQLAVAGIVIWAANHWYRARLEALHVSDPSDAEKRL